MEVSNPSTYYILSPRADLEKGMLGTSVQACVLTFPFFVESRMYGREVREHRRPDRRPVQWSK